MKKLYYDLKLKLSYLINGIKTRNTIHLGDIVIYKNKEWFVNNAIRSCGQCRTRLYDLVENTPYGTIRKSISAPEHEIKKVRSWDNFKRGIFNVYDFNMLYWHEINLNRLMNRT